MDEIENSELTPDQIPGPDAGWWAISDFALTYDGYVKHPNEECALIANERRHETLDDLRTCLFYEQRRWHWQDELPSGEYLKYFRFLVRAIREKVENRNTNS